MPYKSEKIRIAGTQYDRRIKLTPDQKEYIKWLREKQLISYSKLAKIFGVSKRLIQFICCPDKYLKNKESLKQRKAEGRYKPTKAEWAATIREHRRYMEHSNFYAMCDKIRKKKARELHLALEAHGGEFVWIDDENDEEELYDPPIILVNLNDGPMDVVIHKVWLHDGCIELSAFDNEWGNQVDIELEDIVPGHLAYLIEYMPVTDKVKSVAINDD